MSTPVNHWKLGLFVIVGAVLATITVVFFGAQSLQKEGVDYKTYFDESVQGLDVGSPIKFRGVTIGHVSAIGVAPDRRHVAVTSELTIEDLHELGLTDGEGKRRNIVIPPDLRVQLVSQGITGVKFLQIDFFNVNDNPPPTLPFPVPDNTIPAAVSTMKNLEDAIVRAVERMPDLADGILNVTLQVGRLLDDIESRNIPERTAVVLEILQTKLTHIDAKKLSLQTQETLATFNTTMTRANAVLARIDGDTGFLASATRTTDALGDVASNSRGLGQELEQTLRDIQGATAAVERLVDALERDPDMLLKGRGKLK